MRRFRECILELTRASCELGFSGGNEISEQSSTTSSFSSTPHLSPPHTGVALLAVLRIRAHAADTVRARRVWRDGAGQQKWRRSRGRCWRRSDDGDDNSNDGGDADSDDSSSSVNYSGTLLCDQMAQFDPDAANRPRHDPELKDEDPSEFGYTAAEFAELISQEQYAECTAYDGPHTCERDDGMATGYPAKMLATVRTATDIPRVCCATVRVACGRSRVRVYVCLRACTIVCTDVFLRRHRHCGVDTSACVACTGGD